MKKNFGDALVEKLGKQATEVLVEQIGADLTQESRKKVAFYRTLAEFILGAEYAEASVARLVEFSKDCGKSLSLGTVTVDYFKHIHKEHHGSSPDFPLLEDLVEVAFRDLAEHMRDRLVQRIFADLKKCAWIEEEKHLYIRAKNVRHLTKNPNDMAVITLVVSRSSDTEKLLDGLLKGVTVHSV